MDTNKLKKATKDEISEVEVAASILSNSGKPVKIMGFMRNLPLEPAAIEHFTNHREEYVWKAEPTKNIREDINGLYCSVWLTDKYDYIPVIFMSEEVMKAILEIK